MVFTPLAFARKLRDLRESFGNTVDEIGNATGIGTQALQALEGGTAVPSGDEVLMIADFFRCEFTWLIEDDASNPDQNISILLRAESQRLAAEDRHAIADFLHLCKSDALLDDILGSQRPQSKPFRFLPQGTFYKSQGIACANEYRAHNDLPPNAVIPDIFLWLRKAGFRLFRRSLPNSPISGLFLRHPEAGACILINYAEDVYRQRFSAAHEAGHALMDADKAFNVSDENDTRSNDLREIRANTFASSFLMPPNLIASLGTPEQWQNPEKLIEVSGRLFVSIPALLSALKRDKVLDRDARDYLRNLQLRLPDKQEPELRGNLTQRQRDRIQALLATGLHGAYVRRCFEAHRQGHFSLAKLADMLLVELGEVDDLATLFGVSSHNG